METMINTIDNIAITLSAGLLFITVLLVGYLISEYLKSKKRKKVIEFRKEDRDGIILGKKKEKNYGSPTNDEGHVFICAGTGEGKTSAIMIPTLRAWKGNSFVIDISGDIHTNVHKPNQVVFNPIAAGNHPYNVFYMADRIKNNDSLLFREIQKLAFLIMPEDPNATSDDRFYTREGRNVLLASLYVFYKLGFDFCEICERILTLNVLELLSFLNYNGNEKAKKLINGYKGIKESTASSIKQACNDAIEIFGTDESIMANLRRPKPWEESISPQILETKSIYLVIPEDKIETLSKIMRIITAQTMNYMLSRPLDNKTQILFALDEFASLGNMDILPCLRRGRKHHVRILVCTQSLADLDLVYGPSVRRAMMSNFTICAVLLASDIETREYFSKLAGEYENEDGRMERRIPPSEFGELEDELIVISKNFRAKLERNYYYLEDQLEAKRYNERTFTKALGVQRMEK